MVLCTDCGGFGQDPTTLTRRQTLAEGLLAGLQPMATLPATQVDNKMKLLVEVPAAVEEALASLAIADSTDSNIGAPSNANLRVPLLPCCLLFPALPPQGCAVGVSTCASLITTG